MVNVGRYSIHGCYGYEIGSSFAHIFKKKITIHLFVLSSQAIVYTDPLQIKLDESTLMCVTGCFEKGWGAVSVRHIEEMTLYAYKKIWLSGQTILIFLRHELPVENMYIYIHICYTSSVHISTLRIFFLWAENKRNRLDTPPNSDRSHTKPLRYQKKTLKKYGLNKALIKGNQWKKKT